MRLAILALATPVFRLFTLVALVDGLVRRPGRLIRLSLRQESRHTIDNHGLGAVPGATVQFAPVLDHLAVRRGLCLSRDHHGQYLQKVSLIQ